MAQPSELQPSSFSAYPPEARQRATDNLNLLRQLPLSFLPLLLRELHEYDWKFPVERRDIDHQLSYLKEQAPDALSRTMQPFAALTITQELAQFDWVSDPVQFSERLSAYLWSSHQMDAFRKASVDYVHELNKFGTAAPLAMPRLVIAVIGQDVGTNNYKLFRKLRKQGTYFSNLESANGLAALQQCLVQRAEQHPEPFAHWYVDGGSGTLRDTKAIVSLNYADLQRTRVLLVNKMISTMKPGGGGPEALRTELAQLRPSNVNLPESTGPEGTMSRFQLALLTQGSGTQIFSTTFVQWTAREILRRAQPLTLLTRWAPRQRDAAVQELTEKAPPSDPLGSLIDGDMGAYYTWLNGQRLRGADQARFLVWFEGHNEAVACGPGFKLGEVDGSRLTMPELVARLV